jgi:uncharacterized membrane protein (Fun14 family)
VVQLAFEDIIFSAGAGFLFGAVAGYAIRKLIKLAAIIFGLFVVALSYLSYEGWLDVKWIPIENSAKSTLTDIINQAIHVLNNTASHFQAHPSTIGSVGLPVTATAFAFMPGVSAASQELRHNVKYKSCKEYVGLLKIWELVAEWNGRPQVIFVGRLVL